MNCHNFYSALIRRISRIGLVSLITSLPCGMVRADEISVVANSESASMTASVSSSTVRVAEPFTLELTVDVAMGSTVDFPSVGHSLGLFDVTNQVDRADVPSADDFQRRIWTRRLTLESIVTGDSEIPSLEVHVRRDDDSQTLRSEAIPIRVTSVLEDRADPTQFRDIHSVVDLNLPQPNSHAWLWWTLAGSAGVAVLTAILVAGAKRRKLMTPKAWAMSELEHLRRSEALKSSDCEFVTQNLATILRNFLELQFEIPAPSQTTRELLQVVASGNYLSPLAATRFANLLKTSDLARFAGVPLTHDELNRAIDDTQLLIKQISNELQSTADTGEIR